MVSIEISDCDYDINTARKERFQMLKSKEHV